MGNPEMLLGIAVVIGVLWAMFAGLVGLVGRSEGQPFKMEWMLGAVPAWVVGVLLLAI